MDQEIVCMQAFFYKNLGFKVLVWLRKRSRSPKSNHFFPPSQKIFCASLVKFHLLNYETEYTQGSFSESLQYSDLENEVKVTKIQSLISPVLMIYLC